MSTRFNPSNCAKQCPRCNTYENGKEYEFGLALDDKFMKGTAKRLYKESKKIKQWTVAELEQLTYTAKLSYPAYCQLYNELMPL